MTVKDSSIYRTNYEKEVVQSNIDNSINNKFILNERKYDIQFSHIYYQRLLQIKPHLSKLASDKWGEAKGLKARFSNKVLEVKGGSLSYFVGTIYLSMGGKPSIIDDVKRDLWVVNAPFTKSYYSGIIEYSIEDDSGRMKLIGDILSKEYLATGTVVALLGKETAAGDFEVQGILKPGLLDQIPMPLVEEPHYIAFVSGLNFQGHENNENIQLEILKEFLLGGIKIDSITSRNIVKLIVVGNTYAPLEKTEGNIVTEDPTEFIDNYFSELCQSIPVDILPGSNDPTTCALPQQPLHSGLFPKTSQFSTLTLAANPYDSTFGNIRIMGTAGQPLDDLFKCGNDEKTRLGWLEMSLRSRHFAPTCPDTLYCYPYSDIDPFVIDSCPHIFFAGNQPDFSTKLIGGSENQKVRIFTIPDFSKSQQLVLVELGTLETSIITLS